MSSSPLPDSPQLLLPPGGSSEPIRDLVDDYEAPRQAANIRRLQTYVRAYVRNGFNGPSAAIEAGYAEKYANVQSARLLNMTYVQKLLREYTGELLERYDVSTDKVVRELAKIGFSTMADYVELDTNGQPMFDFTKLTDEQWAAIQELTIDEITQGEGATAQTFRKVKFKLGPKAQALHDLGQYLKLFANNGLPQGAGGQTLLPPTVNVNFKAKKELSNGSTVGRDDRERGGLVEEGGPQAASRPGEGAEVCDRPEPAVD